MLYEKIFLIFRCCLIFIDSSEMLIFSYFSCSILTFSLFLFCCCQWFQWPYGDICGIGPVGKGQGTEFNLTFRKGTGKKSETLKFSTEHRTELLTEALVRMKI